MKQEYASLAQLVASALLCAENMEFEYSHFHSAMLVLCALEQISSPLHLPWMSRCRGHEPSHYIWQVEQ